MSKRFCLCIIFLRCNCTKRARWHVALIVMSRQPKGRRTRCILCLSSHPSFWKGLRLEASRKSAGSEEDQFPPALSTGDVIKPAPGLSWTATACIAHPIRGLAKCGTSRIAVLSEPAVDGLPKLTKPQFQTRDWTWFPWWKIHPWLQRIRAYWTQTSHFRSAAS